MNNSPINYETLSQAMNDLKKKGFTYEFDFKESYLFGEDKEFTSEQLKVVEIHRFEGMTNPDDSAILYAIVCSDGSKGLVVDAYGMYADSDKTKFMSDIEIVSE